MHPRRVERAIAWELRTAWATQREVVVVLAPRVGVRVDVRDAPADRARVRGYVQAVAPTNAFALVWDGAAEAHVPLALVVAVRRPHFSAPEDGVPVSPPPPRVAVVLEHQLSLF